MQDAEANKKAGCAFLILVIIFVFMFKDCSGDHDNAAIAKVQATQEIQNSSDVKTAPYRGGVAVLDGSAGYWVFNDVVYATNGTAKIKSPSIGYAPPAIDQQAIEDAVAIYLKDGTINTETIGETVTANIVELKSLSKTTLNNKNAMNFIFGENSRFCSVSATVEHLKKTEGHLLNNENNNPEFDMDCNWDGGQFFISSNWKTYAKLDFIEKESQQFDIHLDAELIEIGEKGRILKVSVKDIPFDLSKAEL